MNMISFPGCAALMMSFVLMIGGFAPSSYAGELHSAARKGETATTDPSLRLPNPDDLKFLIPALIPETTVSTTDADLRRPDPNDIYFLFPGLKALDEKELMDILFEPGAEPPRQKTGNPQPAADPSSPQPSTNEMKPNWKAFFEALTKKPPKSKHKSVASWRG